MVQVQESHPFRTEPPRILHYRKCPPRGGRTTELESVHEVTKELCDVGWALQKPREGGSSFLNWEGKRVAHKAIWYWRGKTAKSWFSTGGSGHDKGQRNSWREKILREVNGWQRFRCNWRFFQDWHQAEDYEYYINLIKMMKALWKMWINLSAETSKCFLILINRCYVVLEIFSLICIPWWSF